MRTSLLVAFIFCLTSFSLPKEKAAIEYDSSRELTWDDYQGRPNRASSFKALTATAVSFSAESDGKALTLSLKNTFEPSKSWTKNKESVDLLKHEQLHFHISEVYARKLRKEILETQFKSQDQALMKEVSKMYHQKMEELSIYQNLYDKETNHSLLKDEQAKWESKVFEELDQLGEFTNNEIVLDL